MTLARLTSFMSLQQIEVLPHIIDAGLPTHRIQSSLPCSAFSVEILMITARSTSPSAIFLLEINIRANPRGQAPFRPVTLMVATALRSIYSCRVAGSVDEPKFPSRKSAGSRCFSSRGGIRIAVHGCRFSPKISRSPRVIQCGIC